MVTPVARVSFNADGTLKSGPGLHGEDFAYVKAVRQLAEEENCLLIDLFDCTKTLIETATQDYADFLMAIVPNDLNGEWPSAYDDTYGDTSKGYEKIEATHYNKHGAFLTTAMLVEKIMANTSVCKNNEYFNFTDHILSAPSVKIAPSTLISKSKVQELNALIKELDIVNTDVVYANPADVVALIDAIIAKGEVTAENHLEIQTLCEEARDAYLKVNVDDRSQVTNYAKLEEYEKAVEDMIDALRPKPVKTVIIDFEDLTVGTEYTETVAFENYSLVATSDKSLKVYSKQSTFTHNGESYSKSVAISTGGSATFNTKRVIAFATEGKCRVTVAAQSTSASADRLLGLHSSDNVEVATFDANGSLSVTTADIDAAGTYYLGSKGSGIYISTVIIEYFE